MILKHGSQSEDVKSVQEILKQLGYKPGPVDGQYGAKTEAAVIQFQEAFNLYADGITGPSTWSKLQQALHIEVDEQTQPVNNRLQLPWTRVPADKYRDGYDRFFLREDVAAAYMNVRQQVIQAGGVLTSSGARRSLNAKVSPSRSATSFHYTGRALDLFVGSGMENRNHNPYIITADGDRYWRVYGRADGGTPMELDAITYGSRNRGKITSGKFIDLTALFHQQGFQRIRARRSFFSNGSWLGAEWWHFQYEDGLESGVSSFGDELLKVYTEAQLMNTAPWKYRHRVFGENWG